MNISILIYIVYRVYIALGLWCSKDFIIKWLLILAYIYYLSSFIVTRDIYTVSSGYGFDMIHYFNAFQEMIILNKYSYFDIINIGLINTGSMEPLFWILIFILSRICSESMEIWFLLVFTSLLLSCIFFSRISKEGVMLFLLIFTSSITFFVFAGSAIRQFCAIPFVILAVSNYNNKKLFVYFIIGMLFHFSIVFLLIPATLVYFGLVRNKKILFYIKYSTLCMFAMLIFVALSNVLVSYLPVGGALVGKIIARMQENDSGYSWLLQYLIESIVFFCIAFVLNSNDAVKKNKFVFFIIVFIIVFFGVIVGLAPFSGVSDRIYRYSYVFYLMYIFTVLKYIKIKVESKALLGIFFVISCGVYQLFIISSRYMVNYDLNSFVDFVKIPLY